MAASSNHNALHRTRLQLETLEDRLVPALLDMGIAGASGAVNTVVFQQANPNANRQSDEFLRLSSNKAVEQGYNTNAAPQFDEVNSRTKAVRMNDLTPITANGVTYRVLQVNVNERTGNPLISLDEMRIYTANVGNLTGYNTGTKQLAGRTAVFDLGDNYLRLDARLSASKPSVADMLVYIPQSLLTAGGNTNPFVYLYTKFGVHNPNTGGNERWGPAVGVVPPPPPPPAANNASISGFVFNDFNLNGLNDDTNAGIPEVTITLRGVNVDNETIEMTVLTGADGAYTFAGLKKGTYEIIETQPLGYSSWINTVGTIDGVQNGTYDDVLGDRFYDITLAASKQGVGYNFAEFVESAPS